MAGKVADSGISGRRKNTSCTDSFSPCGGCFFIYARFRLCIGRLLHGGTWLLPRSVVFSSVLPSGIPTSGSAERFQSRLSGLFLATPDSRKAYGSLHPWLPAGLPHGRFVLLPASSSAYGTLLRSPSGIARALLLSGWLAGCSHMVVSTFFKRFQ